MSESELSTLRPLRAADIAAAFALSAQAGWNQTTDDWRMLLDLAGENCLAVEVDGQLAATTTLLCYGQQLAWVGMVLTHPHFQRRGFARRLFIEVLKRADDFGVQTIKLDATQQGQPLYAQFGFRAEQAIQRWSLQGSGSIANPLSRDVHAVWRNSDAKYFGANRVPLLEKLAQRNPALITGDSYLFARPGRTSTYLGPFVSNEPAAARGLVREYLGNSPGNWVWDLLPNNHNAVAFARDLGFAPQRYLLRMSRGKELQHDADAIYAIAGFELG
jgi:GNAT superfamily N-acetyltransferase